MKETAKRTLNGVPEREFRALYKLEKELYDEWRENTHDINSSPSIPIPSQFPFSIRSKISEFLFLFPSLIYNYQQYISIPSQSALSNLSAIIKYKFRQVGVFRA